MRIAQVAPLAESEQYLAHYEMLGKRCRPGPSEGPLMGVAHTPSLADLTSGPFDAGCDAPSRPTSR
jgi:hypothetical protein